MPNEHSIRPLLIAAVIGGLAPVAHAQDDTWKEVNKAFGKEGKVQPGNTYRISLPRSDLKITLDGVALKPGFALGGWVAFEQMGDHAMVMGDLVLTENEVGPVMQKLAQSGIEIT